MSERSTDQPDLWAAVMALSAGIANAAAANATTVYDVKLSSYTSTTGDAGTGTC